MCESCANVLRPNLYLRYPTLVTCCLYVSCVSCLLDDMHRTRDAKATSSSSLSPKPLYQAIFTTSPSGPSICVADGFTPVRSVECRRCQACVSLSPEGSHHVVLPETSDWDYGRSLSWMVPGQTCCSAMKSDMYIGDWLLKHVPLSVSCLSHHKSSSSSSSSSSSLNRAPCPWCGFYLSLFPQDLKRSQAACDEHLKTTCIWRRPLQVHSYSTSSEASSSMAQTRMVLANASSIGLDTYLEEDLHTTRSNQEPLLPLECKEKRVGDWELICRNRTSTDSSPTRTTQFYPPNPHWMRAKYNEWSGMILSTATLLWPKQIKPWTSPRTVWEFLTGRHDFESDAVDPILIYLHGTLARSSTLCTSSLVDTLQRLLALVPGHASKWDDYQSEDDTGLLTERQQAVILYLGSINQWMFATEAAAREWARSPGTYQEFKTLSSLAPLSSTNPTGPSIPSPVPKRPQPCLSLSSPQVILETPRPSSSKSKRTLYTCPSLSYLDDVLDEVLREWPACESSETQPTQDYGVSTPVRPAVVVQWKQRKRKKHPSSEGLRK